MGTKTIIISAVLAGIVAVAAMFLVGGSPIKGHASADGIQWRNYSEGSALSRNANKKMLVDVYTDWCTWCKRMDKETYSSAEVASYISEHFIPVRLNAESKEVRQIDTMQATDAELATAFGVQEYPTTIFFTENGAPITSIPGYIPTDDFKTVLRFIAEDAYTHMSFDQFKQSAQ